MSVNVAAKRKKKVQLCRVVPEFFDSTFIQPSTSGSSVQALLYDSEIPFAAFVNPGILASTVFAGVIHWPI
jgi:hypothetical protein